MQLMFIVLNKIECLEEILETDRLARQAVRNLANP